jgi:hypothetical protein
VSDVTELPATRRSYLRASSAELLQALTSKEHDMSTTRETGLSARRTTRPGRPAGTPAYYLGRSASVWTSALRHTH